MVRLSQLKGPPDLICGLIFFVIPFLVLMTTLSWGNKLQILILCCMKVCFLLFLCNPPPDNSSSCSLFLRNNELEFFRNCFESMAVLVALCRIYCNFTTSLEKRIIWGLRAWFMITERWDSPAVLWGNVFWLKKSVYHLVDLQLISSC